MIRHRKWFYFSILLLLCHLYSSGQETSKYIGDFNQDETLDTLQYFREFSNVRVIRFTNGKTHKSYDFEKEYNFAYFMDFIPIPTDFMDGKHEAILDSVESNLLGNNEAKEKSPALNFLLGSYQNLKVNSEGKYFDHLIQTPFQWNDWSGSFPEFIYMRVGLDTFYVPEVYVKTELEAKQGWLVYYGHNHRRYDREIYKFIHQFQPTDTTKHGIIYRTNHGLILQKEQKYTWLFHTDWGLTRGPEKLRWSSIQKILVFQDCLILHHISPVVMANRFFIINLNNGKVGRISAKENQFDNISPNCLRMSIENDEFFVIEMVESEYCSNKEFIFESVQIPIKDLLKELK